MGALTIRSRESTPLRGDVLLRTLGRPPAVATGTADDDAGVAQTVEIDETRLDAHFVAIFLRSDVNTLPTKLAEVSVKVIGETIDGLTAGALAPGPRDETSEP